MIRTNVRNRLLGVLLLALIVLNVVNFLNSRHQSFIIREIIQLRHVQSHNESDPSIITTQPTKNSTNFEDVSQTLEPDIPTPPGDMGNAVVIDAINLEIPKLIKQGFDTQGLNQFASDLMSVRRRLPDVRKDWCKEPGRFLQDLPDTSIVIVFYNEAWSVLVRTVHSILDRSPPRLVKEIVLVDDFSYLPHTKTQLDDYFRPYSKVRIVRAPMRLGLIRARILGVKMATAEVITFLDAHVECTVGK